MQEFEERDRKTKIEMENLLEERTLLISQNSEMTNQIGNLISEHQVQIDEKTQVIDGLQAQISDKENVRQLYLNAL